MDDLELDIKSVQPTVEELMDAMNKINAGVLTPDDSFLKVIASCEFLFLYYFLRRILRNINIDLFILIFDLY
jgi:hypothetical protein